MGQLVGDQLRPALKVVRLLLSKLLQMIKPHPGEAKWAEIPWIADPWEARTKAAKEGRPIFIWSGSADVLGCT